MDNKKLILIIDDEPYNIFALKFVLKSKGYAVLSSASLAEGLEILHQHKNINIVLMDMKALPGSRDPAKYLTMLP